MGGGRCSSISARIRTLWTVGTVGDSTDRELLSRFALRQDDGEDAFRVLFERHWPMVLRVCRQILSDRHAAEDATQAVFLVLARKAATIDVRGTVAPWLHGVARRVASKAQGRSAARRHAERRAALAAASVRDRGGDASPGANDWEVIHEEVARLAEKYRTPVVLCYLQGQTYEEAARRIGCPVGTIRVRISRARDRLRRRLQRRGLGPERVAAVGWLVPDSGSVLLPAMETAAALGSDGAMRVEATVRAARALSAGRHAMSGTVSLSVLNLYSGVVRSMMMNRWITAAGWLLAAGMTGAAVTGFAAGGFSEQDKAATSKSQTSAANARQQKPANEPPVDLDSPQTLRKQTERRVAAARQRLDAQRAYYDEGRITINRFIDASSSLMLAAMAASATKDQRMAAAKAHLDRIGEIVKREQAELEKGRGTVADVAEAMGAQEIAACAYLEARQDRGSFEVEILRKRVETLEQQLELLRNQLADRQSPEPPVDLDSPETLRKTNERRVVASQRRLDAQRAFYDEGRITIDRFIDASVQLVLAETAASTTKGRRIAAAKAHWDRMAELQTRLRTDLEKGQGTVADLAEAMLAHENAAARYLEVRQSRASEEAEALKNRIETLEKQLTTIMKVRGRSVIDTK
jgi:RNA polymerase sigma factor (sigma-70 family)